jgi:hypothetical protein
VVEVKPRDTVLGITEGWALERYVMVGKKEEVKSKKGCTEEEVDAICRTHGLIAE